MTAAAALELGAGAARFLLLTVVALGLLAIAACLGQPPDR